jgi:AbiJ N-terminal domain 4
MRFSERHGYKPVREAIQLDSMSDDLRNSLWSLLQLHVWNDAGRGELQYKSNYFQGLCHRLWFSYFKKPIDTLPDYAFQVTQIVRDYFFSCDWYEVYDTVEFIANNYSPGAGQLFSKCNEVLGREVSGYRFVNGLISPITSEAEIEEIDAALAGSSDPVRTHLRRALELLSDKANPDYRNSIKESISAVESLVGAALGRKGTLGQLIKKMDDEIGLHPALDKAFSSLYGYTSDKDGIRHAIMEQQDIGFDEAKFFLVVCSAFANFVRSKVRSKSATKAATQ